MEPHIVKKAASMLQLDEGVSATPYKDTNGYWTIGIGHLIGRDIYKMTLSDSVIEAMLLEDMGEAWEDVLAIFGAKTVACWTSARQLALLNLLFNLGRPKFMMFERTIKAIRADDWKKAAQHLRASLWAKQVKGRADRVCFMVETGDFHHAYL